MAGSGTYKYQQRLPIHRHFQKNPGWQWNSIPPIPPPHFWGQVTSFIEGRMKILHKEYLYRPTLGIFGRAPRFESRPGPHHPNASGAKERGDAKRHEMSHQLWDVGYCVWVSSIQRIPFAFAMFQCLEGFLKSSTLQPCNWPNQCCLGW